MRDEHASAAPSATESAILAVLGRVKDPEIGINIVDLGLVYAVRVEDGRALIDMTMTSAACPLGELLTETVKAAVWDGVEGLVDVELRLVWDPPWTPERMTDRARRDLGLDGAT